MRTLHYQPRWPSQCAPRIVTMGRGWRVSDAATSPMRIFFFFIDSATTEIYTSLHTLSLHDALPIWRSAARARAADAPVDPVRRTCPVRSEEHTSELQSRNDISYAVFCLKKKKK